MLPVKDFRLLASFFLDIQPPFCLYSIHLKTTSYQSLLEGSSDGIKDLGEAIRLSAAVQGQMPVLRFKRRLTQIPTASGQSHFTHKKER